MTETDVEELVEVGWGSERVAVVAGIDGMVDASPGPSEVQAARTHSAAIATPTKIDGRAGPPNPVDSRRGPNVATPLSR